ncbi:MAG: beta-lactamase family protein [Candidatus Sumerlaeia bacterium]|nr:beta-lactamase family protein [Candidatus Sumerlaeia bacterium]
MLAILAVLAGCAARDDGGAAERRMALEPTLAGFRADTFVALDRAMERAVLERADVPGAVLSVGRRGVVVYERALGRRGPLGEGWLPVERDTLFDVASLTKPVATATAAALLVCRGELTPESEVGGHALDLLLRHGVGLPEYVEWQVLARVGEEVPLGEALQRATAGAAPGTRGYSNVGYLMVSSHLETMTGEDLESFLRREAWGPLGMENTTFRPLRRARANIAQTHADREAGRPYDPLADYVVERRPGHMPGHSGLFSTAGDLTRFCQRLLNPTAEWMCVAEYLLDARSRLASDTSEGGTLRVTGRRGRTPAFDPENTWTGEGALYHTGYTGCLMWLDRRGGVSVVLLTNATLDGNPQGWQDLQREVIREVRRGLR